MDAQELRIGNIGYDVIKGRMVEIIGINSTWNDVWVRYKNKADYKIDINDFVGYELTEEWFKRFHTEDQIEKSVRFPNEITIYDRFLFIWKPEYKYWYVVTAYHKEYLTKIEFVHEYQNFILSLIGTELTISEK